MKAKKVNERIDWSGNWIKDKEDPFEKANEYSLRQDLIHEFIEVAKKYEGKIKDKVISDAASYIFRKYDK